MMCFLSPLASACLPPRTTSGATCDSLFWTANLLSQFDRTNQPPSACDGDASRRTCEIPSMLQPCGSRPWLPCVQACRGDQQNARLLVGTHSAIGTLWP